MRAVVSDPFGSFDIASASLTLIDSLGTPQLTNQAMPQVADSGADTSTYELQYTLPVGAAIGTWTVQVTAIEGTEGTVTDLGSTTFEVAGPNLLVVKSVLALSDPLNGSTDPKAIPGATMLYSIEVSNQGRGSVDAGSVVITDVMPANSAMYVDSSGGDPVVFVDGAPPSGLGYNYATDVGYSSQVGGGPPYTYSPVPDPQGFDPVVTGVEINPSGSLAGDSGGGSPSFIIRFRTRID